MRGHLGQAGVLPQQIQRVIGPDHAAPAVLHLGIDVGKFSRRVNALPVDGPPGDIEMCIRDRVWMVAFIAVPLAIVVYFAFTDKAGHCLLYTSRCV